ncbi:MAG: hypothetical protein VYA30_05130 [Myxococcota bacterium]|nr:hypothetical protein [Myxococcota bacterium]
MKHSTLLALMAMSVGVHGCDDSPPQLTPRPDMMIAVDMGSLEDMAITIPDATRPRVDAAAEPLAWIEVKISPTRALYQTGMDYAITVEAFDRVGLPMPQPPLQWRVEPAGAATVTDDQLISFSASGAGTVYACSGDVCGQVGFRADDGPPRLSVATPMRGESFSGPDQQTIMVSGQVTDLSRNSTLYLNGEPIVLDENGQFNHAVEAEFGVNRIELVADDGISNETTSDTRDIVWAPSYLPVDDNGVSLANAGLMRLDQALFDSDVIAPAAQNPNEVTVNGLANLLEVFFSLIDIASLLDGDALLGDSGGAISIDEAQLGRAEVEFSVTDTGLELFLRFPEVAVRTSGSVDLQGQAIPLDGQITISVAARVELILTVQEMFGVDVGDTGVVVESVVGDFEAAGLGALLTVGGGGISAAIESAFADLVDGIVRTQIADFTRDALLGLFGDLRNLPIQLDTGFEGVAPLDLVLSLFPVSAEHRANTWSRYVLDGSLTHAAPIEPKQNDPGVVRQLPSAWSDQEGDGIGIGLRLTFFNALLHEVWRGNLLNLSIPAPAGLEALIESVSVEAILPPIIAPSQAREGAQFELQIGELVLGVSAPGNDAADEFRVSLRSGLAIRFAGDSLELRLDDVPDVTVQLVVQNSDSPLPTSLLVVALQQLVWAQISDALVGGLDFGLGTIDIDPDALAAFAPRIESMVVAPDIVQQPGPDPDQISLEGSLLITLGLVPEMVGMNPEDPNRERDPGRQP